MKCLATGGTGCCAGRQLEVVGGRGTARTRCCTRCRPRTGAVPSPASRPQLQLACAPSAPAVAPLCTTGPAPAIEPTRATHCNCPHLVRANHFLFFDFHCLVHLFINVKVLHPALHAGRHAHRCLCAGARGGGRGSQGGARRRVGRGGAMAPPARAACCACRQAVRMPARRRPRQGCTGAARPPTDA